MGMTSPIRRGLRIAVVEGAWATVHSTLTTGAFLTGFALFLGSNDIQLAVISAVPLLAQVFQIPGAWLAVRFNRRKRQVAWFSVFGRILWLVAVLIPLIGGDRWVERFLVVYAVSSVAMNLSAPAWMEWMSDLVPGELRGRYFGRRNRVLAAVTMLVSLGGGRILDASNAREHEYTGYVVIAVIATAAALAAFVCILLQPDVPGRHPRKPRRSVSWLAPLRHLRYGQVLAFYMYWLFAVGLA